MFGESLKGVRFMVSKEQFGIYIKDKRIEKGLTQEELADKLYISATAISKWENGKTYPDITMISLICNILNISEHEFIEACDDSEMRKLEYEANKYRQVKKVTLWTINMIFIIPLVICFICNLAFNHTLSWFFIVLSSLGITYSLSILPIYVKKEKWLFVISGFSIGIFFTILSAWIYADPKFSLITGLSIFLVSISWIWIIWFISRFSKYRLSFNFIFIGTYFYLLQYLILFITYEKTSINPPYIDLYIAIGLILIGILLFVLQTKDIISKARTEEFKIY